MAVVELVGPAGVGKTTLANALMKAHVEVKIGKPYSLRSVFVFLSAPCALWRACFFLLQVGGVRLLFSKTGINWIIVTGACVYAKSMEEKGQIIIFDQLVFQALRRIAREAHQPVSQLVREFYPLLILPDAIFLAWAPLSIINQRRALRGEGQESKVEFTSYWSSSLSTFRGLRHIVTVAPVSVLRLDMRAPLTENLRLGSRYIEGLRAPS